MMGGVEEWRRDERVFPWTERFCPCFLVSAWLLPTKF
jgi:hypothetical protein